MAKNGRATVEHGCFGSLAFFAVALWQTLGVSGLNVDVFVSCILCCCHVAKVGILRVEQSCFGTLTLFAFVVRQGLGISVLNAVARARLHS